ncbi:MAG: M23 family metallopeptidase [candidate division Zixibacteria bacterium]
MNDKYSLIIVPGSSDAVVNKQISKRIIYTAIFLMVAFITVSAYFAVGFITTSIDEQRLIDLTFENEQLSSQIAQLEGTVYGLRAEMSEIIRKDDYIRLIFDLPTIDPEMREVGIGGDAVDFPPINSELGERTWLVEEDIEKIQRQLQFENASFEELIAKVEGKKSDLDRIPTIKPCEGILSRGFGMHNDPFTGSYQPHNGLDIAAPNGTPVYATADGIVKYAGYQTKLGHTVIIDHGNGMRTYFGHLSKIKVKKGQKISRHKLVGLVGSSGYSTGPHLHYEIRIGKSPSNPYKYIIRSIVS